MHLNRVIASALVAMATLCIVSQCEIVWTVKKKPFISSQCSHSAYAGSTHNDFSPKNTARSHWGQKKKHADVLSLVQHRHTHAKNGFSLKEPHSVTAKKLSFIYLFIILEVNIYHGDIEAEAGKKLKHCEPVEQLSAQFTCKRDIKKNKHLYYQLSAVIAEPTEAHDALIGHTNTNITSCCTVWIFEFWNQAVNKSTKTFFFF